MVESELKIIEELAPTNPELQELWSQHTVLKKQLDKMQSKAFHTPEDEAKMKEVKKAKLDIKTQLLNKVKDLSV